MKTQFTTHKWLPCLLIVFLATACEKDFLDRKPKGQLTFDTYFETADHAVWATNAVYQNFRSWEMSAFPWIGITDIISDDADKGSTPNDALYLLEVDDFTFDATNAVFGDSWRGSYHTIFRANLAIENIPKIDMDEALKTGWWVKINSCGRLCICAWCSGMATFQSSPDR